MKTVFFLIITILIAQFAIAQNDTVNDPQNMLVKIDQEAHFPGGEMAMFQHIYSKVKWPDVKLGVIDDFITVSFNVLTDGSVADVAVMKSIDPQIDKAITDVLKTMNFEPSIQMGTKVKMNLMMNIPVRWRFE